MTAEAHDPSQAARYHNRVQAGCHVTSHVTRQQLHSNTAAQRGLASANSGLLA
jgi:hypothetical protein